jgi:hypothetical protein
MPVTEDRPAAVIAANLFGADCLAAFQLAYGGLNLVVRRPASFRVSSTKVLCCFGRSSALPRKEISRAAGRPGAPRQEVGNLSVEFFDR